MKQKSKNKWLAASLNIVPGLGYIYLRQRIVFSILLLSSVAIYVALNMLFPVQATSGGISPIESLLSILFICFFLVAFIVDAFLLAHSGDSNRYNNFNNNKELTVEKTAVKKTTKTDTINENFKKGALFALIGPLVGATAWLIIWQLGFIASLASWLMASLTVTYYRKGAGIVTRKSLKIILPLIALGIVLSFLLSYLGDIYSIYVESSNKEHYANHGLFSADFINFAVYNMFNFELIKSYGLDIFIAIVFAGLGIYGTIAGLLKPEKAIEVAENEIKFREQYIKDSAQ